MDISTGWPSLTSAHGCISMCGCQTLDISMDISMDIHIHGNPAIYAIGAQFPNKRLCGTVSKALEKSKMAILIGICLSHLNRKSWTVTSSCVSHECNFLKPC